MKPDKLYIEMCNQADEIQRLWHSVPGDHIASVQNDKLIVSQVPHGGIIDKRKCIWLPTQEQLQKIAIKKDSDFLNIVAFTAPEVTGTEEYRKYGGYEYIKKFCSWEQVWLAYTMYHEYNKIWDDKTWVEVLT